MGLSFPVCFQGPSQWVILEFPQRIRVSQLQIQFQGGFLQSPGLPRRYWKALEEGEKGSEGTPWPHSLPLSLLQVLRGVRLSIRL